MIVNFWILLQIFLISFTIDTISIAHQLLALQQGLVLCPNYVPERVDISKKGVNKSNTPIRKQRLECK
jgi:hypothetical protein